MRWYVVRFGPGRLIRRYGAFWLQKEAVDAADRFNRSPNWQGRYFVCTRAEYESGIYGTVEGAK